MQRCIKDGRVVLTYIILYSLLYDAKISCKMCEIFQNNNYFLLIKTFITYNLTEMWHNRVFSCNHRICLCDTKMVPRNERKILHKCVHTYVCTASSVFAQICTFDIMSQICNACVEDKSYNCFISLIT